MAVSTATHSVSPLAAYGYALGARAIPAVVGPAAFDLLCLCSFLAPAPIPHLLLEEGAAEMGDRLRAAGANPGARARLIREACRLSFLTCEPDDEALEMNPLAAEALRSRMDLPTHRLWAERAVRAVNRSLPPVDSGSDEPYRRLLPHARLCAEYIERFRFSFEEAGQLLHKMGFYLTKRERYTDAEPYYRQALALQEQTLGATHPDTATTLNNLAALYRMIGSYAESEKVYQRALAIRQKMLGPEHPDVATTLNNLGELYCVEGWYGEAEPLFRRALAIRMKVLGPEHPRTATVLENYGNLLRKTGRETAGLDLEARAAAIRQKGESAAA